MNTKLDDIIAAAPKVSLDEMLFAREIRAERQKEILALYSLPLISITLNIPGPHKTHSLAKQAYTTLQKVLPKCLKKQGIPIHHQFEIAENTGFESIYVVKGIPSTIKHITMRIEDTHPLGRIFDLDVLDNRGTPLPGSSFGRNDRLCILCDKPATICARNYTHPTIDLARQTAKLIQDYLVTEYSDHTATLATRALLYEVITSPKPGLVDKNNNGSHTDMTIFSFADSAAALTPYFRDMTREGFTFDGDATSMLPALRERGIWAEETMYAATGGVNTHKGLIFSLGILCAAAGYLQGREEKLSEKTLLTTGAAIASNTPAELEIPHPTPTHGQNAYAHYGLTGVRGEVAAGYPSVRLHSLPALRRALTDGYPINSAGVFALLHLLAHTEDTNVAGRAGYQALVAMQNEAKNFLVSDPDMTSVLRFTEELDQRYSRSGVSPGGVADLLALTYFLHFLLDA